MTREYWWVILICLGGALWHFQTREPSAVLQGAGVVAPNAPVQVNLSAMSASIAKGRFILTPLADFTTEARVLSRLRYSSDDGAELSPIDFALGWGRMSDSAVIEQLDIGQGARFFTYRWADEPPIPPSEIIVSASNMHLIPEDIAIERALDRVRAGQVVRLKGQLVKAERADGWLWTSSLSREDTGAGACELFYVRQVTVINAGT